MSIYLISVDHADFIFHVHNLKSTTFMESCEYSGKSFEPVSNLKKKRQGIERDALNMVKSV